MNMGKKICLISKDSDFSDIETSNKEIFSFDYITHRKLEKLKIKHTIAENFLNYDGRLWVFEQAKKFQNWYDNPVLEKFELMDVNLFGLLDEIEFHTLLMEKLISLWTIKKILEKREPSIVECTEDMKKMIIILDETKEIKFEIIFKKKKKNLLWDTIDVKQNIIGKPISMKVSREKYNKLKNILDKTISFTFQLWFDFRNKHKKTILLLEMYPPTYKQLFYNLKNDDYNIIILNRRRPVTLDKESIRILKNSNCKLISKDDLFEKNDFKEFLLIKNELLQKIDEIWKVEDRFEEVFRIENKIFWSLIKNELREVFVNRLSEYIELVCFMKKVYEKINIKSILSLYETGETEKAFLNNKNKNIDSFLLEHGFSLFFKESKTFGMISSYDKFTDKIFVWSELQKNFMITEYNIEPERIFPIGSPRHDNWIINKNSQKNNKKITVLIAPTPITQLQGYDTTEIHIRFKNTIKNIVLKLQDKNIELIFKIHPSQSEHNDEIRKIIETYSKKSSIYLFNPVKELIQTCDVVITITPEGWAPSTIMLESMILGKPALNIILDDRVYDFEYIKQNAAVATSYDSIDEILSNLIDNSEYRKKISSNALLFTKQFLCNYGNSSKKIANFLINKKQINA